MTFIDVEGAKRLGLGPATRPFGTCAYDAQCWDKPTAGKVVWCFLGLHQWQLNFYRSPGGPDHYHCIRCGKGAER
jgi:hypothetical protein